MNTNISRNGWVKVYREGFKRGASERKSEPTNRRDKHPKREQYDTAPEREAFDAGFEYGRDNAVPGANIDIEKAANAAYDRSGYSNNLGNYTNG